MKKLLTLIGSILFLLLPVSCDKVKTEPDNDEIKLEGTWEGSIEADMAQGYRQKYRVTFNGDNYTLWHMHQEFLPQDGKHSLYDVGQKETGTWTYSDGQLVFTPKTRSDSYYMTGINPPEYVINPYNVDTMEANPWHEWPENQVSHLDKRVWTNLSQRGNKLNARINMDLFTLTKK